MNVCHIIADRFGAKYNQNGSGEEWIEFVIPGSREDAQRLADHVGAWFPDWSARAFPVAGEPGKWRVILE